MHVLDANELFWVTSYTYDRIMEIGWKNWPDAFALYFKLMKQARIQQTNQTYSLNEFLKKWLWRWDERLKKAKDILKSLWLVDDLNVRNEKWKIMWHYIRVNYLINEEKVRTSGITYNLSTNGFSPGMDETQNRITSTSGQTDANALSTKIVNAWNTKEENSLAKFEEFWNRYPKKVKKKDAKRKFNSLSQTKQQLAIEALEKFKQTDQRKRGYIPDPTTYINQERREDEIETKEQKPSTLVYH